MWAPDLWARSQETSRFGASGVLETRIDVRTVAAIMVETLSVLVLIYFSATIQVDILKHTDTWFPLKNPALVTIPLSFFESFVVSLMTPEQAALGGYQQKERRMILGAPAE